jgi:hypothetical protein
VDKIRENTGDPGRPMVLLWHQDSAAGDHFDWMIQDGEGPDAPLRSWRVMVDPGLLLPGDHFITTPTPHHRAAYLTLEGELSGGRGRVQRVRSGFAKVREDGESLQIETCWDDGACQVLRGLRINGMGADPPWRFMVVG